jgi:hypothetical protein
MTPAYQIHRLGQCFGRTEEWAKRTAEAWSKELQPIPSEVLDRAIGELCCSRTKLPTLADVLQACRGMAPRHQGEGCRACDGTGWRLLYHHLQTTEGRKIRTYAATCDCERGQRRQRTRNTTPWAMAVDTLKREYGTIDVYFPTEEQPDLESWQTTQKRPVEA